MRERMFIAADRRVWFVRPRHEVRRHEADTHVTLEMMSDRESRVVSCRHFPLLPPGGTPVFNPD